MTTARKNGKKDEENTASTRSTKVKTPAVKITPLKKESKMVKDMRDNITSTAPMITELARMVTGAMAYHVENSGNQEKLDLKRYKILVTLEAPKNSAGTHKKDGQIMGHFTGKNQWQDSDKNHYRAININPFMLRKMSPAQIFECCYHEGVHAIGDWLDQCPIDKKTGAITHAKKGQKGYDNCHNDCSSNGRHLAKFAEEAGSADILECTKVNDYRGYETSLTEKGEVLAEKIGLKDTTIFSKNMQEKKIKPKAKRVAIECHECGLKSGIPYGKWIESMKQVMYNDDTTWEGQWDIPVQKCLACEIDMIPAKEITFTNEEIIRYTDVNF